MVDKIIISEKSDYGEEDFYRIKFILKTGELINENLTNGKIDIGTNFGKYGFTITKQELEEAEDNVTAYVLQRHSNVNPCNFLYFVHLSSLLFLFLERLKVQKDHTFNLKYCTSFLHA